MLVQARRHESADDMTAIVLKTGGEGCPEPPARACRSRPGWQLVPAFSPPRAVRRESSRSWEDLVALVRWIATRAAWQIKVINRGVPNRFLPRTN
jgi:hypothetical protein